MVAAEEAGDGGPGLGYRDPCLYGEDALAGGNEECAVKRLCGTIEWLAEKGGNSGFGGRSRMAGAKAQPVF